MNAANLSRLESLSQLRVDQTQLVLDRQRDELSLMDRQQLELRQINRDYQHGIVGDRSIAPQVLAQRRAFVEQLTQKLELLAVERQKREQSLQRSMSEQREQRVQTAAISAMAQRRQQAESEHSARKEQNSLEQIVQSLRHVQYEQGVGE